MKSNFEYRQLACETLKNRWGEAAIAAAVIIGLASITSLPTILIKEPSYVGNTTSALSIFIIPVQYAFFITLLNLSRGRSENILGDTFQITGSMYGKMLGTGIIYNILIALISIVTLGIGGIILSYAYRMVPYLLYDYPELSPLEALKISRQMMRGHKGKLFILDLSFIGWILLGIITLGVGFLFVTPYMQTATALFYEDLKAKTIVEYDEEETIE